MHAWHEVSRTRPPPSLRCACVARVEPQLACMYLFKVAACFVLESDVNLKNRRQHREFRTALDWGEVNHPRSPGSRDATRFAPSILIGRSRTAIETSKNLRTFHGKMVLNDFQERFDEIDWNLHQNEDLADDGRGFVETSAIGSASAHDKYSNAQNLIPIVGWSLLNNLHRKRRRYDVENAAY